jgi:hypothetical protein
MIIEILPASPIISEIYFINKWIKEIYVMNFYESYFLSFCYMALGFLFYLFIYLFGRTGLNSVPPPLVGLTLERWAFSHLSHSTSPFFAVVIFQIESHTFCLGWPQSVILPSLPPVYLGLYFSATMPNLWDF